MKSSKQEKKTIHAKHESESQTPYLYINLSKKSLRVGSLVLHICTTYLIWTKTLSKITNNYTHETHFYRIFSRLRFGTLQNLLYKGQVQILYMLLLLCCSVVYRVYTYYFVEHFRVWFTRQCIIIPVVVPIISALIISGCLIKIDFIL